VFSLADACSSASPLCLVAVMVTHSSWGLRLSSTLAKSFSGSYFFRLIIFFANVNVSRHILVVVTSVLAKSNMGRRE
jgi:hypothetical protein